MNLCSLFFCSLLNHNPSIHPGTLVKDTIYYVVFYDLIGKEDRKIPIYHPITFNMSNEIKDVERQIKNELSSKHVLLPIKDTCLVHMPLDSISRRDNGIIHKLCEQCGANGSLLIVDATWIFIMPRHYRIIELISSPTGSRYWAGKGSWWKIRTSLFDIKEKQIKYFETRNYAQTNNSMPTKHLPGIGHRRYFKRVLKKLKNSSVTYKEMS